MAEKLTIAIDFDNTFTADTKMWTEAIKLMQAAGHRVVCVSARRNEFCHRHELMNALPDGVEVFLSYGYPKRLYMEDRQISVDIWIDDCPEAIPTKADMLAVCG